MAALAAMPPEDGNRAAIGTSRLPKPPAEARAMLTLRSAGGIFAVARLSTRFISRRPVRARLSCHPRVRCRGPTRLTNLRQDAVVSDLAEHGGGESGVLRGGMGGVPVAQLAPTRRQGLRLAEKLEATGAGDSDHRLRLGGGEEVAGRALDLQPLAERAPFGRIRVLDEYRQDAGTVS